MLFGISLEVPDKSIVSLLGPNGAGKSTTLWTITGVVKPWEGRILLEGTDVTKAPPHKKVEMGLALVPEGRRLFPEIAPFCSGQARGALGPGERAAHRARALAGWGDGPPPPRRR